MSFGFILFLIGAVFLISAFLFFDKILKFQYQNYLEIWHEQGKAIGFIWIPTNTKLFLGGISRSVRLLSWTFGNDDWMKNEPKILKLALFMRISIFSFWAIWLVGLVLTFAD